MYNFAHERHVAELLIDELNAAIKLVNGPGEVQGKEAVMIADTFVCAFLMWWRMHPKMQLLADIEEWRTGS